MSQNTFPPLRLRVCPVNPPYASTLEEVTALIQQGFARQRHIIATINRLYLTDDLTLDVLEQAMQAASTRYIPRPLAHTLHIDMVVKTTVDTFTPDYLQQLITALYGIWTNAPYDWELPEAIDLETTVMELSAARLRYVVRQPYTTAVSLALSCYL